MPQTQAYFGNEKPNMGLFFYSKKVGSHCQLYQLDQPDPLNFPIKPDQARLKGVYKISFWLQTLDYPNLYASFTQTQIDQLDLCSIAARSLPDKISLRSDITRVEVGKIGYNILKNIRVGSARGMPNEEDLHHHSWSLIPTEPDQYPIARSGLIELIGSAVGT